MSQIKQLLQLHEQGKSIKFIARSLGISKNTVKVYLSKIALSPVTIKALLSLDDPILEGKFHAGNPAYKDQRYEHFKNNLEYFIQELKKKGVTRHLLWEEYLESYPGGYGRSQFNFHLSQHLVARKPSGVLTHKAGEKLYIDFAGDPLSGGVQAWFSFGSFLAMAAMLYYAGRRYYWQTLKEALTFRRQADAEAHAVWACRRTS